MNKRTVYTDISEYFQIALGIFLASIGLKAFLLPNGFLDGGVTGTAILVNSQFENLNVSVLLILINIPFLILAYFTLSKRILIKSVFSIIGLALVIHFVEFAIHQKDFSTGYFIPCGSLLLLVAWGMRDSGSRDQLSVGPVTAVTKWKRG